MRAVCVTDCASEDRPHTSLLPTSCAGLIDSISDKSERVATHVERQTERVSKMRERASLCSECMHTSQGSGRVLLGGAVFAHSVLSAAVPWTVAVVLLIIILIIAVVPFNNKP